MMDSIGGELICAVCLEFYEEPLLLPCGHNFCKKCIYGVIENGVPFTGMISMGSSSNFKCPVCQKGFSAKSNAISHLPRNKALENIISVYKTSAPVDIFDTGWNSDLDIKILRCPKHQLSMESFCRPCNLAACRQCETEHHQGNDGKHKHEIFPIKDVAFKHQAEIADSLTEIKKRSISLNERLQLLKDIQQFIENSEKSVVAQLDHHINTIMSSVRKQHEELKQCLQTDFSEIRRPVENELRRCNSLKMSMQQLMKKISDIKRTVDSGLRISLMIGAKKQLNSLLCFDIAWSLKDDTIPTVELPTWKLDVQNVLDRIGSLAWEKQVCSMKSVSIRTEGGMVQEGPTENVSPLTHTKTDASADSVFIGNIATAKTEKSVCSLNDKKAKVETTFGVNNKVFEENIDFRPKLNHVSAIKKLPENGEASGLSCLVKIAGENRRAVEVSKTEQEKHATSNFESGQRKGENKKCSLSAPDLNIMTQTEIVVSDSASKRYQEIKMDSKNKSSADVSLVENDEIGADSLKQMATPTASEDLHHDGQLDSEYSKNYTDNVLTAVLKTPDNGARPKVVMNTPHSDYKQDGDKVKPNGRVSEPDLVRTNGKKKTEPMKAVYTFEFDEEDNRNDQFLSHSLNKLSFNAKKESREEHRKSFPPDPQVDKPILKPRASVAQRLQKPKQRSPHQDAVAKFVARRRTSSPQILKTVSSQNLQSASNKAEFPKTMSSPVLSEMSIAKVPNGFGNEVQVSQGHIYPEKTVCMKFV